MDFRLSTLVLGLMTLFLLLLTTPTNAMQCYKFTWANANDTDCDEHANDLNDSPIPCIYPIVYTEPRHLPPDLNDLENHCASFPCPAYKCTDQNKICIRWAWYDVNDVMVNYTAFCGTVADITKEDSRGAVPVTSGCWTQKAGTATREVCACDDYDLCNSSPSVVASFALVSLFSVAVQMIVKNYLIS